MSDRDLLFYNSQLVTPNRTLRPGWLLVNNGIITDFGLGEPNRGDQSTTEIDLDGAWLGPGFIDIHTHGSAGVDVMHCEADDLHKLSEFFVTQGVTSYLAGTYTLDHLHTLAALERIGTVASEPTDGSNLLGAYMEGPYLSVKRRGAHRTRYLRAVSPDEVEEYLETGAVRAMVVAPEVDGADWLIEQLKARKISAVAGHTDATYQQIARATDQGVRCVTHLFNGMRGIHHREPGAAGAALLLDTIICEVIADGNHVSSQILDLIWRMKGASSIALITDAGIAGGLPDGEYRTGDRTVNIVDGTGYLQDGTISSSARTYIQNFKTFCKAVGVSFDRAWECASQVPAKIAGVDQRKGSIEIGKDADLVALSTAGSVLAVVVGGRLMELANRRSQ